jgi:hypothetical protein
MAAEILCRCGRSIFQDYTGMGLCCEACSERVTDCTCPAVHVDVALLGLSMAGQDGTFRLVGNWREG